MDLKKRKFIWIALSNFYLDQELKERDFAQIAATIKESPYSFIQVKKIDKEEVFPVLSSNSQHTTGVWSGFNEVWLVTEISKKIESRTRINQFVNRLKYAGQKKMYSEYWKRLEQYFQYSKLLN